MSRFNNKNYEIILACFKDEMNNLENRLKFLIEENATELSKDIEDFLFAKSKRLRPLLIFLMAEAVGVKINDEILNLALAVEILHAATLIHDDIIDDATLRRNLPSLNIKYSDKMAVIAGDYLVAICLNVLNRIESVSVFEYFSNNTLQMCKGEIKQYFQRYEVPSVQDYIEKSKSKTTSLFMAGVDSLFAIIKDSASETVKNNLRDYVSNFSLAFQIADDIDNFNSNDSDKLSSDMANGTYTLPIILMKHKSCGYDIIGEFQNEEIKSNALALSYEFLDNTISEAIENIKDIKNDIKQNNKLIELVTLLKAD